MTLTERDRRAVWHPYTPLVTSTGPITIVRGDGAFLFDDRGERYIDAISSWWVNLHGHSHPYIAKAISEQASRLEHVMFGGFTHEPAVTLAEKLLELLPKNAARIFFSDDGSTAVEVALKLTLQFWRNEGQPRHRFVAIEGAYHGDTFGAMAVSSRGIFTDPFEEQLFPVDFLPFPDTGGNEECACRELETFVSRGDVAGFIFEPLIQGTTGMRMYRPEALEKMLQICRKAEVVTIADEVMTGFGRTGKLFATRWVNEVPDLICLSKGLTGGAMAMGATSVSKRIVDAFLSSDRRNMFFHGHSFTANPLACAAALASLELLKSSSCADAIVRLTKAQETFVGKIQQHKRIQSARSCGTIAAIEFKTEGETSYLNSLGPKLQAFFMSKKIILRPLGNVVYVMPPYCISAEDLSRVHEVIVDACNEVN